MVLPVTPQTPLLAKTFIEIRVGFRQARFGPRTPPSMWPYTVRRGPLASRWHLLIGGGLTSACVSKSGPGDAVTDVSWTKIFNTQTLFYICKTQKKLLLFY